jgi:PAS domain S-box-containing protein
MSAEASSPPPADTGLLDLLPDPVIGLDAERRVVEWNRAAAQAYGFSRTEAIGQRAIELLRMSFPLPLAQLRDTMADTGVWRGDVVARAKDGSTYVVDSVLVAERDEQGRVNRVLAVHRDVTARLATQSEQARSEAAAERERIHARMRRAQRLESIGQLAGGVAHDFNNLLAIIINYTALIVSELDAMQRAPHRECWDALRNDLGEIQNAADRAARLTHQLLAFSRQGVGNPVLVDLNDAVTSVEELLGRTIGEHIELRISLADSLRMIRADDSQLEQMLLNLSINSRDAMPDGGTLTIDTADVEVDEE